ncbi:MAG TPA: hypothetical protein VGX78_02760, partial [Pirellulales bacterium]|nr:hypothetical protein [Pirellulales bacterium]
MIEPEVLSKDLARYVEARRNHDEAAVKRLIARAMQRHRHGWNVGQGERIRPLLQRQPLGHASEERLHAALRYQHQRRAHFRRLPDGKIT